MAIFWLTDGRLNGVEYQREEISHQNCVLSDEQKRTVFYKGDSIFTKFVYVWDETLNCVQELVVSSSGAHHAEYARATKDAPIETLEKARAWWKAQRELTEKAVKKSERSAHTKTKAKGDGKFPKRGDTIEINRDHPKRGIQKGTRGKVFWVGKTKRGKWSVGFKKEGENDGIFVSPRVCDVI